MANLNFLKFFIEILNFSLKVYRRLKSRDNDTKEIPKNTKNRGYNDQNSKSNLFFLSTCSSAWPCRFAAGKKRALNLTLWQWRVGGWNVRDFFRELHPVSEDRAQVLTWAEVDAEGGQLGAGLVIEESVVFGQLQAGLDSEWPLLLLIKIARAVAGLKKIKS